MKTKTFDLHIYHTSDTHGHLTSDSFTSLGNLPKGFARVSSFFKTHNNMHQIKIDLGDTIQGSPLTYLFKQEKKTSFHPFVETVNHIGYDYFIVGNHDFNYGLEYLDTFISGISAKTLCGNVYKKKDLYFKYAYDIKKYQDGPKVVVLGLTNNYIPNWETKETIKDLVFENAFSSAKKYIEEIKKNENPDLIIVGYHGGYECNIETNENEAKNDEENLGCKIFNNILDIDLLLTGHEHRQLVLKRDRRVMVQPGYAASHVSHVTFRFEEKHNRWEIKDVEAKLIAMIDFKEDEALLAKLKTFLEVSNIKLDQVIGKSKTDFLITNPFLARLYKHPVIQYINQVQMKVTNADISVCSLGNDVTGFHETITLRDVLNTYVFPNTLYLCEIDGKTLYEALNHNAKFFILNDDNKFDIHPTYLYPKKELYNYDIFDGISYDIIVSKNEQNKVRNVNFKGKKIENGDIFTIVLNSYRMSGGGNINWHHSLKMIKSFPLDISEILIDDITNNIEIGIDYIENVKVLKETD